jgi:ADP-ribosylglycohydrolase
LVVVFGCLALAEYDPLTSLQLSMEWGHDTDSYAQLLGAFIGALHGPELFRSEWRDAVAARLRADHQVDLEGDCRLLARLNQVSRERAVVRDL